jgi:hypothetical protein
MWSQVKANITAQPNMMMIQYFWIELFAFLGSQITSTAEQLR